MRNTTVQAISDLARDVVTPADMRRARLVEHAIDNQGNPRIDNRDFIPIRSPDGTVWRIRVTNAGALTVSEAPS